ncbi:MAG TPA: glycosyltransferase family 4 protein [Armatimonadota bacterium]|jgi:glycosyltransferase involved in cell wall biosynthesis
MRALLVTNLYPSRDEPTRGVFNLSRFSALARHCEVRVVSPLPWWSRLKRPVQLLRAPSDGSSGLEAIFPTYWSMPGRPSLHAAGMYLSLRGTLKRIRRQFPYDVLLAAWAYPEGVAAARFAREAGIPLVTMVLGSDINEFPRQPELRKRIRWGLGQSQRVVAVSRALAQRVMELGVPPERVLAQHNGVDGERFQPRDRAQARLRLGLPADRSRVTYVGNYKPEKGVEVLVEAFGLLRQSGQTEVSLSLVGSGPLEPKLRARVQELGLQEQVQLHGRRPHEEVPEWIAATNVLCLPSYREGCPNVVLESLASGRPVVASDVGGVSELLDERGGGLVPAGDPDALARALRRNLNRDWDPGTLRGLVECLSWDQYGWTLHGALEAARQEFGRSPSEGVTVSRLAPPPVTLTERAGIPPSAR